MAVARSETNQVQDLRTVEDGRIKAEPLGTPAIARQQAVTTVSANIELTATCRRVSIAAEGCKMRFKVGAAAQTANAATSHAIRDGERLDFAVPVGAHIAIIRDSAATADGVLEISELT